VEWKTRKVNHPAYGTITGEELMLRDIASHDCRGYATALRRLRRQQAPFTGIVEEAPGDHDDSNDNGRTAP
jgi:hypothetical protein